MSVAVDGVARVRAVHSPVGGEGAVGSVAGIIHSTVASGRIVTVGGRGSAVRASVAVVAGIVAAGTGRVGPVASGAYAAVAVRGIVVGITGTSPACSPRRSPAPAGSPAPSGTPAPRRSPGVPGVVEAYVPAPAAPGGRAPAVAVRPSVAPSVAVRPVPRAIGVRSESYQAVGVEHDVDVAIRVVEHVGQQVGVVDHNRGIIVFLNLLGIDEVLAVFGSGTDSVARHHHETSLHIVCVHIDVAEILDVVAFSLFGGLLLLLLFRIEVDVVLIYVLGCGAKSEGQKKRSDYGPSCFHLCKSFRLFTIQTRRAVHCLTGTRRFVRFPATKITNNIRQTVAKRNN